MSTAKKVCLFIVPLLFFMLTFYACGQESKTVSDNKTSKINENEYSEKNFQQTDTVEIVLKNYGTITVGLDANHAPKTVENFKKLANSGFYNNLTLHRIIKDFMVQGGDPKADGTGGSADKIKGEFSTNGVNNNLAHTRGAISMARKSNDKDSASSQFFIVHQTSQNNSQSLDGQYACFGYVINGMDIVDKICEEIKPIDNNGLIEKSKQPIIETIRIK